MLCTQVPYWIHWATQFWCFDKTPSAESCPAPPRCWKSCVLQKAWGGYRWGHQALQSVCTTVQGLSAHMLCSFSWHFSKQMCEWKQNISYCNRSHLLREGARCLFPTRTQQTLPKHSRHSLAGMCGLRTFWGVLEWSPQCQHRAHVVWGVLKAWGFNLFSEVIIILTVIMLTVQGGILQYKCVNYKLK